jgi:glycine hydroxymethyltransferase
VLGIADITVNKNMVPFDTQSPFVTSGIRIGTAAITTRGLREDECKQIAQLIDAALSHRESSGELDRIRFQVNGMMRLRPLFVQ